MAIALTALETATRIELRDEDSLTWTTAQVDAAIAAAVRDFSQQRPDRLMTSAAITTTNGRFALTTGGPLDAGEVLELEAFEFPPDLTPRQFLRFTRWGDTIALSYDRDLTAETANLWYTAPFLLGSGSYANIDARWLEPLAIGAAAYAMRSRAVYDAEALTTNPNAAAALRQAANEKLATFRDLIRDPRIKQGSLFRPAEEFTSHDIVQWPT